MNAAQIQDYTRRISQANKSQIIVIIYDLADQYLLDAVTALEAGDTDTYTENCHSGMKCITHLMNALDDSYELAQPLGELYEYMNREIGMACARYDKDRLTKVQGQLRELGGSFREVAKGDASAPVMENSQTVYAGLTYGKGNLHEDLYDEGNRRGYQA